MATDHLEPGKPPGILDGLRVLDLGNHVAGPFCAKLLADYGADVIKIEPPHHGDSARRAGPFAGDHPHPEKSIPFLYVNTNKRGVTLNTNSSSVISCCAKAVLAPTKASKTTTTSKKEYFFS